MSDYSTIGKVVMDYTNTERDIACLEQQMGDIGKLLIELGTALRDTPARVTVGASIQIPRTGWTVAVEPEPTSIPLMALDVEKLRGLAAALAKVLDERERLIPKLDRMGLQNLAYQRDGEA